MTQIFQNLRYRVVLNSYKGTWTLILDHFADDPDLEHLIIDSTIGRAHPCAAGALASQAGLTSQALGRS